MNGGITFRGAIEANKKYIISTLERNGEMFTNDILNNYAGEKEKRAVRTALNELRKEGKVTTDDHVYMWQGKKWKLSLNAL
jgi:hypothetical protein